MSQHTLKMLELIGIGLAVVLVLILVKMVSAIPGLIKTFLKEYMLVMIWRHFTGAHYHGERISDATWFKRGQNSSRKHDKDGFMDRWEHKPRAHRALWRTFLTLSVAGLLTGLIADFTVTVNALKSIGVYLLVLAGFAVEAKVRLRMHNKRFTKPTAASIAPVLRITPHAVETMLHVDPENIKDEGEIGWLGPVPNHLTPAEEQQATVARIIDTHLPVATEMEWLLGESPRIARIMAILTPPDTVMWRGMLADMQKCALGEVVIGQDKYKHPFKASLTDLDDPHWGFDVNTKFGKSNFLGVVTVQILRQDPLAQAIIVDPKRSSLIDFVGDADDPHKPLLKGVTMANEPDNPEAMWAAVQKARGILDRRSAKHKKDRTRKFPCVLIILDELNQFNTLMKGMWDRMKYLDSRLAKADREGLAGQWPGWDDIYDILQMGRFVNMHFIVCSQDFRDDIFGGRGGRNYLGFKGMAGFNPGQWDKFMQTKPVPSMQNHVGRWMFSDGSPDSDTWVQVMFADAEHDRAAYEYAAEGRDAFLDNDGDVLTDVTDSDDDEEEDAALATDRKATPLSSYLSKIGSKSVSQTDDTTDGDDRRIIRGWQGAADYFGWTLSAFDSARRRLPIPHQFKQGRTPCWYEDDLLAWEASRPRSKNRHLHAVGDDDTDSVSDD